MRPITAPGQRHLLNQIVQFSRSLHGAGVPVNPANLIDLCRCMSFIDIRNKADFQAAARATLLSSQHYIQVFDQAFNEFWFQPEKLNELEQDSLEESNASTSPSVENVLEQLVDSGSDGDEQGRDEPEDGRIAFSPDEVLMKKDLARMSDLELDQARRLITSLIAILANYQSHRRKINPKGKELDFRKMLRHNAFFAPDGMALYYRKRKIKKVKLMLLCDVSGSMAKYSQFLIQFIFAMRQQLASLEVAVFSTRMTVITDLLNRQTVEQSLREVSATVQDWGGGTNIGNSLREFNVQFARDAIHSRTVAIIMSDGWDRGDTTLMREEMQRLRACVHSLLWLNPQLGDSSYQPLCQGMQTALPFIDHFLPVHNLESFASLIRHLRSAWR